MFGICTPNPCIVPGSTIMLLFGIQVRLGESRQLVRINGFLVGLIYVGVGI